MEGLMEQRWGQRMLWGHIPGSAVPAHSRAGTSAVSGVLERGSAVRDVVT